MSITTLSTPPVAIGSVAWGVAVNNAIDQINSAGTPTTSPTFSGTVTLPATTSIGTVSATEISYLDNVTSAIQTQLNAKAPIASPTFTGVATIPNINLTTSINDANGNEVIKTPATTSAVNEITVTNSIIGIQPSISASGGDTNIDLEIKGKGTGILVGEAFTNTKKNEPYYRFDGVDDYISVVDNDNLDFGTGTMTFGGEFIFSSGSTTRYKLIKNTSATAGYRIYHNSTNNIVARVSYVSNNLLITSSYTITDGNYHTVVAIIGIDANSCYLLIDGIIDTGAIKTGNYPTLTKSNSASLYLGSTDALFHTNAMKRTMLFNYALTADKVKRYSRGESLDWEDIGGSNVNRIPENDSSTFVTDGGYWIATTCTKSYTSGEFVINGTSNGWYIQRNSLLPTIGKSARLKLQAKSSNRTSLVDVVGPGYSVTAILNPSLTTSYQNYEFIILVTSATNLYISILGALNTDNFVLDNIEIYQLGCTAEFEPSGITPLVWRDKQNSLMGAVNGGLRASNLPKSHIFELNYNGVTADTSYTSIVPYGYMLNAVKFKNTTTTPVNLRVGYALDGAEVITLTTVQSSATNEGIQYVETNAGNKYWSDATTDKTLVVSNDSGSAWGTTVNITFLFRKVI